MLKGNMLRQVLRYPCCQVPSSTGSLQSSNSSKNWRIDGGILIQELPVAQCNTAAACLRWGRNKLSVPLKVCCTPVWVWPITNYDLWAQHLWKVNMHNYQVFSGSPGYPAFDP